MITMIFKFSLAFILSYLILSVDISGKTIFEYLHSQIAPISRNIHNYVGGELKTSLQKSVDLGRKFFTSSAPPSVDVKPVNIKHRIKKSPTHSHLIQEELRKEDIEALDKIIEKN
jgi:hypothetical protein